MSSYKLLLHNRDQKVLLELDLKNKDISEAHRRQKFEKMLASPYVFFRGSNHLYCEDFYNDWRINFFGGSKETLTWINGDAHIYNYGASADHNGQAVFCMDDFDDSIVADYQFDLWRMAISIVLDCREHDVFTKSVQKQAIRTFSKTYRQQICTHDDDEPSKEKHLTVRTADGLLKDFLKKVEKKKNRLKMLNKWTILEDGNRRFDLNNPKVRPIDEATYHSLNQALKKYQTTVSSDLAQDALRFEVKDIVRRVRAGTGSLGSARYYALLEGDTNAQADDVILDIKEQGKPPLYDHMNPEEQEEFDRLFPNPAERHALAFQALSEHPDKYLGWLEWDGKYFSVKQRSPFKADFPTQKLKKTKDLIFMAKIWGYVLASRHKKASYVLNEMAHEMPEALSSMIKGKEEDFDEIVISIAFQYADCVKQDYEYLVKSRPDVM
jgi:uncharacterized protein (DUF2252 family)